MNITSSDALLNTRGWREVQLPRDQARLMEPGTRAFQRAVDDGHLTAFVSQTDAGWHVSISHRLTVYGPDGRLLPGRLPTWDEIHEARYRFVPDAVTMAMLLPPRAEYVNLHPTCMHLWQVPGDTGR